MSWSAAEEKLLQLVHTNIRLKLIKTVLASCLVSSSKLQDM